MKRQLTRSVVSQGVWKEQRRTIITADSNPLEIDTLEEGVLHELSCLPSVIVCWRMNACLVTDHLDTHVVRHKQILIRQHGTYTMDEIGEILINIFQGIPRERLGVHGEG